VVSARILMAIAATDAPWTGIGVLHVLWLEYVGLLVAESTDFG
jgi:hypothetical protein